MDGGTEDGEPILEEELIEDGGEGELEPVTVEDRARAMGWKPREEYRGDVRRWTDAETFIAHGEAELPILRDQSRRMSEKIARFDTEVASLKNTVAEQAQAVKDAMNLARRADQRGYERGIAELKAKQREAVEAGDTQTYDQVDEQIRAAEREREAAPEPTPAATPAPQQQAPETAAFLAANPWFHAQPALRNAMIAAHNAVMALNPAMGLAEQYEAAKRQVVQAYPAYFPEEDTMPAAQPPTRPKLRVAASLEPSAPVSSPRRGATPFDRIQDPSERTEVKAQYERIKRMGDAETTAEEYVALYLDPHQDVLAMRAANRRKA